LCKLLKSLLFLVILLVCAGLVGLSLSYTFTLTGTQIFFTWWYCNLLNYIISVERIKQFIQLPEEPPAIVEDNWPPFSWPSKGRIDLQALEVKLHPCISLTFSLYFSTVNWIDLFMSDSFFFYINWFQIRYRPNASLVLKITLFLMIISL